MSKAKTKPISTQAWPETPQEKIPASKPSNAAKRFFASVTRTPSLEIWESELQALASRWIDAVKKDHANAEQMVQEKQGRRFKSQVSDLVRTQGEEANRALLIIQELRNKGLLKTKRDREAVFLGMKLAFHIDRAIPGIYPNADRGSNSLNRGAVKGGSTVGEGKRKMTDSDVALIGIEGKKRRSKHSQRRTAELLAELEGLRHLSSETIRSELRKMGM